MKKKKNKYWKNRVAEDKAVKEMLKTEKEAKETLASFIMIKNRAEKKIKKEIKRIYDNYKIKHELDDITAQEYLDEAAYSDKEYKRLLMEQLECAVLESKKKEIIAKYNAHAYNYRITRWTYLSESIASEIAQLSRYEYKLTNKYLYRVVKNTNPFATAPKSKVNEVLATKFYGKNYSERIWDRQEQLTNFLNTTMKEDFLLGKGYAVTAKKLEKALNVNSYEASRLVRTEGCFFHNKVKLQDLISMGVEEYKITATLDRRTSKICRKKDGEVHKTADAEVGVNFPPFHPNCRTTIYPYIKDITEPDERIARDYETDKNYVTKAKTYEEYENEQFKKRKEKNLDNNKNYTIQYFINDKDIKDTSYVEFRNDPFSKEYIDLTRQMFATADPNSHEIKRLEVFVLDGKIYDNKIDDLKFTYSDHEFEIAQLIEETFGGEIYLLPNMGNFNYKKMSDYFWKDERWDLKTLKKGTDGKNAFTNQAKKAKGQSNNIIIDIQSEVFKNEKKIYDELSRMYGSPDYKYIDKVIIVKDNEIFGFYKRS